MTCNTKKIYKELVDEIGMLSIDVVKKFRNVEIDTKTENYTSINNLMSGVDTASSVYIRLLSFIDDNSSSKSQSNLIQNLSMMSSWANDIKYSAGDMRYKDLNPLNKNNLLSKDKAKTTLSGKELED